MDVCIVGAGPAASIAALELASSGHSVVLAAASRRREASAESITPQARMHLERWGVWDEALDRSIAALGHRLAWWTERPSDVEDVRSRFVAVGKIEVTHDRYATNPCIIVDRNRFDDMLLKRAALEGASPRAGRAVSARRLEKGGWEVHLSDGLGAVRAKFVIQATGRSRFIGGHPSRISQPIVAYTARMSNAGLPAGHSFVEAAENAWCWIGATGDGIVSCSIFAPAALSPNGSPEDTFRQLRQSFRLVAGDVIGAVRARSASAYVDFDSPSVDFIKAGESSFVLDPIAGQGVHASIRSGIHAAAMARTVLSGRDPQPAIRFYAEQVRASAEEHVAEINRQYAAAWASVNGVWPGFTCGVGNLEASASDLKPRRSLQEVRHFGVDTPCELGWGFGLRRGEVLRDGVIAEADVLDGPGLSRPVAFLGSVAVAPLLRELDKPFTIRNLVARWSKELGDAVALDVACRLVTLGAIAPVR